MKLASVYVQLIYIPFLFGNGVVILIGPEVLSVSQSESAIQFEM